MRVIRLVGVMRWSTAEGRAEENERVAWRDGREANKLERERI